MKFQKLEIRNFKCYLERIFEFTDGLNIVFGPNESGKSTLYQAIVLSLYGPHTTREKHFGNLDRDDFRPLGTQNEPCLKLLFSRNETQYSIERDFAQSKVQVEQRKGAKSISSDSYTITRARDFIKDMLGGVDEDVFQKYASINHIELSRLDAVKYREENQKMGRSLLKMIESQRGEGIIDVTKRISKELKEVKGEEENVEETLDSMQQTLSDAKTREDDIEKLKKQIRELNDKISMLQREHDELHAIIEKVEERQELEKEIQNIQEKLNLMNSEFNRLKRVIDEEKGVEEKLEKFSKVIKDEFQATTEKLENYYDKEKNLKSQKEKLEKRKADDRAELDKSERDIEEKYGLIKANLDDVNEFRRIDNENQELIPKIRELEDNLRFRNLEIDEALARKKSLGIYEILCLTIVLLLVVIGVFVKQSMVWIIFSIPIIGSIVTIIILDQKRRALNAYQQSGVYEIENELKKIQGKKAKNDSFLTQISNKLGCSSRVEMEERYSEFRNAEVRNEEKQRSWRKLEDEEREIDSNWNENEKIKKSLLETSDSESLIKLENELAEYERLNRKQKELTRDITDGDFKNRIIDLETSIRNQTILVDSKNKSLDEKFKGDPLKESEYVAKKKRFEEVQSDLQNSRNTHIEFKSELRQKEMVVQDSYEEIEEQVERLKTNLVKIAQKKEELEYLKNVIEIVEKHHSSEILPLLEKRAKELFESFAGTSDKTFSILDFPNVEISSKELSGFEEKHLSQGTRDQLFFALRIAWSDVLTPEDLKLPLLWDDPFVYWDIDRLKGAINITSQLIKDNHQIILFTHREDVVELFNTLSNHTYINLINLKS